MSDPKPWHCAGLGIGPSRFALAVLAAVLTSGVCHAQTVLPAVVNLDQQTRSRGESLSISITNGPAASANTQVLLSRAGKRIALAAEYRPPSTGGAPHLITAQLSHDPQALPLGYYDVEVELDGRPFPAVSRLELVPLGNPKISLDQLNPDWTDATSCAYFEDDATGRTRNHCTEVVGLVLRGSNFQTAHDNRIVLDGVTTPVEWRSCAKPDYGTQGRSVPKTIIAEQVSSEELRLCRVPVPPSHEILVRTGFGDHLSEPQRYRVFSHGRAAVTLISAVVALALALIPLVLLSFLRSSYEISRASYKLRLLFLDQETDTYSLSKLQFYLWTVAALFSYCYFFVSRVFVQYADWPDVPDTLPGVIAVSAGTSIGSQFITASKGSKGAGDAQPNFADLITSGGVVAPDRLQMLLWTLFGVAAFVVTTVSKYPGTITELPAIPDRLLYLMGLSSFGYLGGKMARKPGPVINEIAVSPASPDDVLAAQTLPVADQTPDLAQALSQAKSKPIKLSDAPHASAQKVVAALASAISEAKAAQTATDFSALVDRLAELRAQADDAAEEVAQAYAKQSDPTTKSRLATDAAAAESGARVLQLLTEDVTYAIATTAAAHMQALIDPPLIARTITLRGTNLSSEGMFQIDQIDLPFRMLVNTEGKHEPDVLAREPSSPSFARLLRLTIEPSRLESADLERFKQWFGTAGCHHFTLTNVDGQKAELGFSLPPGESQKLGAATP